LKKDIAGREVWKRGSAVKEVPVDRKDTVGTVESTNARILTELLIQ